jgi:hypothetical protein
MTKQEIITLLIKDYEWAIEKVSKMEYLATHEFLVNEHLSNGVCNAAKLRHDQHIYCANWVYRSEDAYWTTPPKRCETKEEIIQSLQTRLDILNQELLIP